MLVLVKMPAVCSEFCTKLLVWIDYPGPNVHLRWQKFWVGVVHFHQSKSTHIMPWFRMVYSTNVTQCALGIFNLDQKFHGLSCSWGINIHETVQNQSRKTSDIRLPKFTTVNMARKWHHQASFSKENLFFEDCSFGSLMTDVFLD